MAVGFRVVAENEVSKAIELIERRRTDLVLLDLSALAKENRRNFSFIQKMQSHPPIIFLVEPQYLCLSEQITVMDRVVSEVARDVIIWPTETVDYTRWDQSQRSRFFTWLLTAFAGTALALAAVGVFGVLSYTVTRRRHEMGIRMALGARSRDAVRLILRNGILMTSIGLAIGLAISLALARFLESRLSDFGFTEVKPTDLSTLATVSLVLALVALFVSYLPARRATKIEPMVALRDE